MCSLWWCTVRIYANSIMSCLLFFIGKRWVECRNKGQISIPEMVDIETQVLDLSGNNLQILPREVFSRRGLLNLQKLYLSNCKLGQIDPTAFRGLTNLVELDLSGNLLTSVPTATFSGIKDCCCLSLWRITPILCTYWHVKGEIMTHRAGRRRSPVYTLLVLLARVTTNACSNAIVVHDRTRWR